MTCFDAAKSKEEFGAKEWNNITNYTVARDHRKQINTELKKVTDVLVKETTSALQEKGVPMDDYVLIESFVNYYQPGTSSRSGIGTHEDGTDMSVVVQLLNTGTFHATVTE